MLKKVITSLKGRKITLDKSNSFLKIAKGIIHVGANTGQERWIYGKLGLRVLWIEPIPEIYNTLVQNIRYAHQQIAINYLVSSQNEQECQFNISSNNGLSSSIMPLGLHREVWPDVVHDKVITLSSKTLPTLLKKEGISLNLYDTLILDTQGSELLILEGAESILHNFTFIKLEVADFEAYVGCCTVKDIENFMIKHNFIETERTLFATKSDVGNYYDIVYVRDNDRH